MAMGADRGIHILCSGAEFEALQPLHISKILAKLAGDEKVDMIIVGKQVKRYHNNETGSDPLHGFPFHCRLSTTIATKRLR